MTRFNSNERFLPKSKKKSERLLLISLVQMLYISKGNALHTNLQIAIDSCAPNLFRVNVSLDNLGMSSRVYNGPVRSTLNTNLWHLKLTIQNVFQKENEGSYFKAKFKAETCF